MNDFMKKQHRLQGGHFNSLLREWQTLNTDVGPKNLMYPVFIIKDDDKTEDIHSMPGISRYGFNRLKDHLDILVQKGLRSVLLFGVVGESEKDYTGTNADSKDNPVIKALPRLKSAFPELIIACDVCLCAYTSHGHCGILNEDGSIDNFASVKRISEVALSYAKAGAHIVAPSDMMDGRVGVIKEALLQNKLENKVSVLSYSAKFASVFYGPFRDAAQSAPAFGDRKSYQLPPGNSGLAIRATARDVEEGADMLMVKPGLPYLDIVRQIKDAQPNYPLFVYQVSGEYSMLYNAAKSGAFDLKVALNEVLISMRRAGADVIITYFTPTVLEWLHLKS